MKKYKLKSNDLVINNAEVVRNETTNEIEYIDWSSTLGVDIEDGVEFSEDEKDFMITHYCPYWEVIEVE